MPRPAVKSPGNVRFGGGGTPVPITHQFTAEVHGCVTWPCMVPQVYFSHLVNAASTSSHMANAASTSSGSKLARQVRHLASLVSAKKFRVE